MMKDMYWGKMMYANNRMIKNSEVETLTEEQHEVLAELCAIKKAHKRNYVLYKITEVCYYRNIAIYNSVLFL